VVGQAEAERARVVRLGGRVVVGELARVSLWAAQRRIKGWRGSATWRSAHFTSAGPTSSEQGDPWSPAAQISARADDSSRTVEG
jgi:hypothetical protein